MRHHADKQLAVTVVLLLLSSLLGVLFFRGFTRGLLRLAIVVVAIYLLMNAIVLGSGMSHLTRHSEIVSGWWEKVLAGDWQTQNAPHAAQTFWSLAAAALALFPKLALGLSGFELTMIVMPLVRGSPGDDPAGRAAEIRSSRLMLVCAALLGSIALIASATVTSLLVPEAFTVDGRAAHRALAYLAHRAAVVGAQPDAPLNPIFGLTFGTAYDFSAVAILCLAGMSVGIGLRDHVPPYLHRLGMDLNWSAYLGGLIYLFAAIKLVVTVYFRADLMLSGLPTPRRCSPF